MLIRGTITCLAGEPGTGKSVLSYALGLAIATGTPALSGLINAGRPRRVLYFDQENSWHDRTQYIQWAWRGLGRPDDGLLHENFFPVSKKLGHANWFDDAVRYVKYWKPDLILFDTAISCFDTQDENSNSEASVTINKLQQLLAIPDDSASALVLRHAKDNSERRAEGKKLVKKMRGASVWKSQVDQTIYLVKNRGRRRGDGLDPTRLERDKRRAFGFKHDRVFIDPQWINGETLKDVRVYQADERRSYGIRFDGSTQADADTKRELEEEDE